MSVWRTTWNEKTKFKNFLNNNEIVTYKNIKDLANKIVRFNKNNSLRKKIAKNYSKEKIVIMNMCGRGDKDIFTIAEELNINL